MASCCKSAARAARGVAALLFAGALLAGCAQAPGGGGGGVTTQGVETTQEVVTTAAGAAIVTHGPQGLLVTDSDNWQAAYEAGLAAATAGDFKTAVAFFLEAQPKAPLAPQIMYNLGLASARAGYDLLALAWLRAYLVAEPGSTVAGPVAQEIERLEQAIDGQADLLFQKAIELAQTLPTGGGYGERAGALDVIASFQAGAGRLDDAFATLSLVGSAWASDAYSPFDEATERMDLIAGYGAGAASVGDVATAQSVLDRLSDETRRKQVQDAIGERNRVQSEIKTSPTGVLSSGGSCCYIINPVVEALGRGQSASSVTAPQDSPTSKHIVSAVQGDLDAAFAGVKSESDGFLGDQRAYMFNQITRALLFQGDVRAAEAAAELAREYTPAELRFGRLAEVAELLVAAGSGDVDAALQDFLDHTKQSVFLRNADGAAGIGALEGYIGRREDGLWALCTHLMASGEVDEALGTLRRLSSEDASRCLDQRQLTGDGVDRAAAIAGARDQVRADMLGGAAEIAADRQARILAMNAVAWGIDTRLLDLPEIFRRGTTYLETPTHLGSVGGDLARAVWSLRIAATQ